MLHELTIKQEKFILKYFECGNATEAYKYAYDATKMKDKQINEEASKLLKHPKITQRLKELREEMRDKTKWTLERVLEKYTEVIEIGLGKKPSKHITAGQIEIELCDTNLTAVNTALNAIAKHLGMFKERIEVSEEFSLKDFVKMNYEQKNGFN